MPIAFSPLQASYTRQQIHEATGLSLDVIGYWIKEGLLQAKEAEGQGRGKHRRFGFEALHIAAILTELHRYGIGLTGLRGVADALWSAARLLEQFPGATEDAVLDCKSVVSARKMYPPRVSLPEGDDETYSFEDWFEEMQSGKAAINPSAFVLEPIMTPDLYAAFALHFDLFSERSFTSPHIRLLVARLPAGDVVLWPTDIPGSEQFETLPAYLKLNVSLIIRGIWDGLKSQEPSPANSQSEDILDEGNNHQKTDGVRTHPAGRTIAP